MSYKAEQVKILTIYIISSCFIFRADNIYHHLHDYLNSMFFFLFDAVLSNARARIQFDHMITI